MADIHSDDQTDYKSYPDSFYELVMRLHPHGPGVVQLGGDAARCLFQRGVKIQGAVPVSRMAVPSSKFYGALKLPDGRVVEAWKAGGLYPNVFLFDDYPPNPPTPSAFPICQ